MANPCFETFFKSNLTSDATLIVTADGQEMTYRAFFELAGKASSVLASANVSPGDRVAVQTEKSVTQLALYAACLSSGAVYLPLNTAYTPAELDYFIGDAEPRLVVVDPKAADDVAGIANKVGAVLETLDPDGTGSLWNKMEAVTGAPALTPVDRDDDDLAAILYTSGTTGRSKGAMLTQKNLTSNATTLADVWRFDASDRLLHALPTFHAHGLFVACNVTFTVGSSMIFLPKFDAATVLGFLPSATTMMGVPTFYTRLLSEARFDKVLCAKMRLFISGSAPLLAETHREFEDRTGHRILERYGMTETSMNSSNPYDGDRRAGSVGPALPEIEIKITDPETGETLPANTTGMVEVRGPNVFKGYWRMPEKTAEELRENGFLITGDLGQLSEDHYLTIVGRSKDLVISGGYNVYPKEVETEIDDIDGVTESAVIGAPHPDFGEGVVAIIVASNSSLTADDIRARLADKLAKFKQPKKIIFVDALPRNTMGKVQKNILRDEHKSIFDG